jgi:soluble lytic murein transglycosylase-like protein
MSRTNPRRWAWRAMLSALAGGGLTAAGLGGPLAGGALAADVPAGTPSPAEGSTVPVTSSTPATETPAVAQQPTNTSTTSAPASTPQPSTPPAAVPAPSTPAPSTPASAAVEVPVVVVQRPQKTTPSRRANRNLTATRGGLPAGQPVTNGAKGPTVPSGPNNVAPSPQLIAAQAGALAAELAFSAASAQALGFYRIPLFLLPIYRAAAIQYGVPWQILAAINEVETNYGSDLSVSSAGAEGWMQFEPSTWLQYGVDALDAGYADPYNPVDAIFAAARYLHAAGASRNLRTAILAYNHSDEYASSVLLRAKLISSYPKSVIATLTGLVDARLPVTGKQVAWGPLLGTAAPASSATANATAVAGDAKAGKSSPPAGSLTPGSVPAPSPTAAAADAAMGNADKAGAAPRFVELTSAPSAAVVAVQNGRILGLGSSRKLGKYVILRDIYGDVFTYAGLGSIAPTYRLPKSLTAPSAVPAPVSAKSPAAAASNGDPTPSNSASAPSQAPQSPLTLRVKRSTPQRTISQDSVPAGSAESVPLTTGKVRLFAHPGNPDALAAAARVTTSTPRPGTGHGLALGRGSLVTEGTVLGHVRVPHTARDGHLRFAIQPAGDPGAIDPRPVLENWKELGAALHPQGAKGQADLLGATASDVFLLSKSQLELAVLSDPGIDLDPRARHEVATGSIDRRVLAMLSFLSRSGLKPTVSTLRRGPSQIAISGKLSARDVDTGGAVDISAVNGIPIAGHEGSGTITDTTIRTLLTLQGEFAPSRIVSLMKYPGAASTLATREHSNDIHIGFKPAAATSPVIAAATAKRAHSAASGETAPSPFVASDALSLTQWNELLARIGSLPAPTVASKPSSAAIVDHLPAPSNSQAASSDRGPEVPPPSTGG